VSLVRITPCNLYKDSIDVFRLSEGTTVAVLEEDDGSGWVKVTQGSGDKGLVPASYVEITAYQAPSSFNGRSGQFGFLPCFMTLT
jgi:Variant SH3 domain